MVKLKKDETLGNRITLERGGILEAKRKQNKINYKEKGITLIALVVTIIILLILAGVTVSLVVGQNGLLQRAQTASNTMANATANELTQLDLWANEIDNLTGKSEGNSEEINFATLLTTISSQPNDCAIDRNGNIIPINVWDSQITGEETCEIYQYYESDYDTYSTAYNGGVTEAGKLEYDIPVYIRKEGNNYLVNRLGDAAFKNMNNIKEINIPENITSIGRLTFEGCSNLVSVNIPNGLASIGNTAFASCTKLPSIIIPNSVTNIGSSAFHIVQHIYYSGSATGAPWGALAYN